jgi:hypothetical protein
MYKLGFTASALALASVLGGCASVTRGWNEQITIASTPSGALAEVTGNETPLKCVTPCVVQVRRQDDLAVQFSLEGHEPQIVKLNKEIASQGAVGFAGNILLGGAVGMVVDGVSGAALDHKPNPVTVVLEPVKRAPATPAKRKPAIVSNPAGVPET